MFLFLDEPVLRQALLNICLFWQISLWTPMILFVNRICMSYDNECSLCLCNIISVWNYANVKVTSVLSFPLLCSSAHYFEVLLPPLSREVKTFRFYSKLLFKMSPEWTACTVNFALSPGNLLISRDRLVRIWICWTLDIPQGHPNVLWGWLVHLKKVKPRPGNQPSAETGLGWSFYKRVHSTSLFFLLFPCISIRPPSSFSPLDWSHVTLDHMLALATAPACCSSPGDNGSVLPVVASLLTG